MRVNDLTCLVYFDGVEWPDEHNPINRVVLFNRIYYAVGACDIFITDNVGLIGNKIKLLDGTPIRVVTSNGRGTETWRYRIAKVERPQQGIYRIIGYEDQVKYVQNASTGYYNDTSAGAIRTIARECGMEVDADDTSDKQVWLGFGRRMYEFARSVALHGYAGTKSLMWLASYKGKLLYKDLNAISLKPVARFSATPGSGSGSVPSYFIQHIAPSSTSGINNTLGGYGAASADGSIASSKEDTRKDIEVRTRADKVQVNSDIKGQVTTPPTGSALLRSDNTHENYNLAQYQNLRGWGQLSEAVVVFTPDQTNVGLFDTVEVIAGALNGGVKDPTHNPTHTFDGKYMVDSRNIQIEGSIYNETLMFRREGVKSA